MGLMEELQRQRAQRLAEARRLAETRPTPSQPVQRQQGHELATGHFQRNGTHEFLDAIKQHTGGSITQYTIPGENGYHQARVSWGQNNRIDVTTDPRGGVYISGQQGKRLGPRQVNRQSLNDAFGRAYNNPGEIHGPEKGGSIGQ